MRFVILLTLIALVGITYSKTLHKTINKINNEDPNDETDEDSTTTIPTTTAKKTSLVIASCDDSYRCGCYKGNCWSYIDEKQPAATGWWCFTQTEGVKERRQAWAKCTENNDCSWTMTCGDCYTFVGQKKGIKTDKILC